MKEKLFLLTSFIFLFSCDKPAFEDAIRPVRYQKVSPYTMGRERTFSGVAQANIEAHLSFRVPGSLEELPISIGQKVEKGQFLAKLDPHDYQLKVQEAQAGYIQAMAKVRQATSNYDRIRLLYEKNNVSRNELDLARAAAESSSAALLVAEKRLEFAQSQLNYTTLTAPFSGSIAAVPGAINENVAAGQHVLMLSSVAEIEVSTSIPEKLISQIHLDTPVKVTFDAIKDQEFTGDVKEIGIMSDVRTTYPVTVGIQSQSTEIRSGMTAEVHFTFQEGTEKTVIPSHALFEENQQEFVFIVEPVDASVGKIKKQQVKVGKLANLGIEILEGLQPGDLLITGGIRRLTEGQKVLILEEYEDKQG